MRETQNSPIVTSQIRLCKRTIASTASATQHTGTAYMAIQKKRRSVGFWGPLAPPDVLEICCVSRDSKTQWLSPVEVLTSFHQRRPTRRRPAMFFR